MTRRPLRAGAALAIAAFALSGCVVLGGEGDGEEGPGVLDEAPFQEGEGDGDGDDEGEGGEQGEDRRRGGEGGEDENEERDGDDEGDD